MIILCDVDGVVADCATPVHTFASNLFCREIPKPETWPSFDFATSMGLTKEEANAMYAALLRSDRLGPSIEAYEGAHDFLQELTAFGTVVFVTSHWKKMHCWVPARDALCESLLPGAPVIYAHDKHMVRGDVLIDDRSETIFANRERALMFDQPWNRSDKYLDSKRCHSFEEVLQRVQSF